MGEDRLAPARGYGLAEHAGLGEGVGGDKRLGFLAAVGIDEVKAAERRLAVIRELGASPDQLVEVGFEIGDVGSARFGAKRDDNPGRLARWGLADLRVVVDYAHNPDGLGALLSAAATDGGGRLGLVLGQAGNRGDAEIRELAATAARFEPAFVVLKDIESMQRGRASGEVAALLRAALLQHGVASAAISAEADEVAAARRALALGRAGDTLVLPVHGSAARLQVETLLDRLQASAWRAGQTFD